MQNYELTIVLDGKATPAKQKSETVKIEKMVKTLKGKVVKTDNWGKKDMVYPIQNSDTGVYLCFQLELDSKSAKDLDTKLNTEGDLLRYLFIKKE